LQHADAADVTQAVLLKLAQGMRTFVYDPSRSFRAWLKTLTHHAWQDLVNHHRLFTIGEGSLKEGQHSRQVDEDLAASLEEALDREVFEHAVDRVRLRVHPHTWQVFRLTALEGLSGAETANRLNVPLTTVYKAKSNVQKLLQEEVRRLEGPTQ
jgi:RNA polymerase sigma-70 factor (ECF subfamily)